MSFLRTNGRLARLQANVAAELDWGELFRFVLAGSLSTFIHIAIAVTLMEVWAMHPSPANMIAFTFAFLAAFSVNRYWTFRRRDAKFLGSIGRYAVLALIGYSYNGSIAYVFEDVLHVHYVWSLAFLICTWPLVSYYVAKTWVFSSP